MTVCFELLSFYHYSSFTDKLQYHVMLAVGLIISVVIAFCFWNISSLKGYHKQCRFFNFIGKILRGICLQSFLLFILSFDLGNE